MPRASAIFWKDQEMSASVNWIRLLSFAAAFAVGANHQVQLFGQEFSQRRFGEGQSEQLPPPERPGADAEGPTLIDPGGNDRSARNGRAYLGITFDLSYPDAAVVQSVVPGGPAAHAGIEPGDTIDAINDYAVTSYRDAFAIVAVLRPGEIIDIDFSRRVSGRTQAVLGDEPAEDPATRDYSDEATPASYLEREAPAGRDELLPDPTYDSDYRGSEVEQLSGSSPNTRNMRMDYNGAANREYDGASNRQVDTPPARRPIERRRASERGILRRPLLPWRRTD
jgi:hypothetical protein